MLQANPSIEVVHLSIGGNDVLGDWRKSFTIAQRDTLAAQVSRRLQLVIDTIKTFRPGIRILWGGYVYTNFEEVITQSGLGSNHPFYSTWQKMEFPSNAEMNTVLNYFSDLIEAYTFTDPQVDFIKVPGLMQYTFGQTTALGVAPGGTYAAYTVPLPLGDPAYPSPKTSMRDYLFTKDCFHLAPQGYLDMIEYHTQKFYHKLLMDDLYLLSQNSTQTGSVSSSGAVSPNLYLGESSGESFATELTFNTTTMLDTTLAKASIFLRREALTGTNPISGSLQVKVKNGILGAALDVEAVDYSATGDGSGNPCLYGANTGDKKWIRLDLPVSMFQYIKKNAPTQFVISASGFTGGKVTFSNASDPDYAPVLNLKYGTPTVGINEVNQSAKLSVYPNPVHDILNVQIAEGEILQVGITDLLGKAIPASLSAQNTVNTAALAPGAYILNVTTKAGKVAQRFIKQ